MHSSNWTPSNVPNEHDQTVTWWLTNSKTGSVWREADYEDIDLETVMQDLLSGQYNNPIRVVTFNTAEKWSQDVSEDVASRATATVLSAGSGYPFFLQDFTDRYEGRYCDIQLPVPMRAVRRRPGQTHRTMVASDHQQREIKGSGLLFDDAGNRMIPTHATKNRVRYRYYISKPLQRGHSDTAVGSVFRVPAEEIEAIVARAQE
jgi:hypothetical protein